ncbi:hypothetical protein [Geodermatophilus poikilotrophus]|uniref:Uncharacterized protein n=1 Tax=Geodermatophilus poikilotrophus TaxID=1333667 RepID=A0A1I0ENU2_9ACTN|nr:hypothetical protein [Geodermatophilus poikilotrophus]SET46228.1 hypothetical protein SAMN04488546_2455 [Geodermatophilus poikilotrophus]
MASTVLDARETPRAPSSPDRRRPPVAVLAAAVVGVAEAVALLAGGLTGLDGLLLSPLRPAGPVVAVVLLLLAGWVVLCAGGGVLLLDRSGRRVYTAVATAEVALVGALVALALLTPLFDTLPVGLPLPALALLTLGLPVGKLLLAGAPSTVDWVAQGPRPAVRRPEPAAVGPRTRAVTLALIGLALLTVALTTPVPGAAPEAPATVGTSRP